MTGAPRTGSAPAPGAAPTTRTNKIVKRTLVHQKWRRDRVARDRVYVRGRGEAGFQEFDDAHEQTLRESFVTNQRQQLWDL